MMSSFCNIPRGCIKRTGGFTLVELMVTLAIAAVCMGLAATILFSGTTMTANQLENNNNKNLTSNIMDFMRETIQYSSAEVLVSASDPDFSVNKDHGWVFISDDGLTLSEQGYLYFKIKDTGNAPQNVFGLDFYNTKKVGMNVCVVDDDTLQLTVKVYDSSGTLVHQMTDSISLTKKSFDPSMPGVSPTSGDFSPAFIMFK